MGFEVLQAFEEITNSPENVSQAFEAILHEGIRLIKLVIGGDMMSSFNYHVQN